MGGRDDQDLQCGKVSSCIKELAKTAGDWLHINSFPAFLSSRRGHYSREKNFLGVKSEIVFNSNNKSWRQQRTRSAS